MPPSLSSGLEDGDAVARFPQVDGAGHARGSAADDGHFLAPVGSYLGNGHLPAACFVIRGKSLERANGDRLIDLLASETHVLAGVVADAADGAGEGKPLPYHVEGFEKLSFGDEADIIPGIQVDGAAVDAGGYLPVDRIGGGYGLGEVDVGRAPPRKAFVVVGRDIEGALRRAKTAGGALLLQ